MPDDVINRLYFFSNAKTILAFIKSKNPGCSSPPQFSLNSIKPMPEKLFLPDIEPLMPLIRMNVQIPELDKTARKIALSNLAFAGQGKPAEAALWKTAEGLRKKISDSGSGNGSGQASRPDQIPLEILDQAISNFREYRFFCHYDWRMANWGTVEDILSVEESTFDPLTSFIEFKTQWTPPIAALQSLANIFPSVRFELKYHYHPDDPWSLVEIFPLLTFSY